MGAADFERLAGAMDTASMLAQKELAEFWDGLDKGDPERVRDALLAAVPAIVSKYGNLAAVAAAQYYERERAEAGGGPFRAALADPPPPEQVESVVRYACGHLF